MPDFFRKNVLISMLLCALCACNNNSVVYPDMQLWYEQPADEWMEALPVGNGRVGAMVFGGVNQERIALNEVTLWTGGYDENQDPVGGAMHLDEMRKAFFDGDYDKVHALASQYMVGKAEKFGTHVPFGDMLLQFYHTVPVSNYRRALNLNNAVASVEYTVNDTLYKREVICSYPAQVLLMKLSSDKENALNFDVEFDLIKEAKEIKVDGNKIVFHGFTEDRLKGKNGVEFCATARVEQVGGTCTGVGEALQVRDANEVLIYFDLNTDYKNENPAMLTRQHIEQAVLMPYDELRLLHCEDHNALFSRVKLSLGDVDTDTLPTDVRQKRMKAGEQDPSLAALFMQYGRYMLIAGSRENSPLPMNLQGIWNDNLACNMAWTCDYHLDINTQQNYWNANVCNLAECNEPLFDYIESLVEPGRKTVRTMYGTRGWTAHTTANAWGHTPCSGAFWWGAFPTGGTWLALQMIEHYRFTQDTAFMLHRAYPILKENAQFLLDYLTPDPHSEYLLTGPSISPENSFTYNGGGYCLTMMPTVDRTLTYELFGSLIDVCCSLDIDMIFCDTLRHAIEQLPPYKIGSKGQLQEWYYDYEERQPNHRHTSHLLGLYPYAQITDNELEDACRVSIENRLYAEDWEDTEWSRANNICYYARLRDAQAAHDCLLTLMTDLARENLFTMSPAGIAGAAQDIFCPDANMAGSAAVAEMLLQSHKGYIELLAALPKQWSVGSFDGLCARGGAVVSAQWNNSQLQNASIIAKANNRYGIQVPVDKSLFLNGNNIDIEIGENRVAYVDMYCNDVLDIK